MKEFVKPFGHKVISDPVVGKSKLLTITTYKRILLE
jgi:hypothetical protein